MGRGYEQLTLEERHMLFRLHEAGTAVGQMADRLGWHRSTIYRELSRSRKADGCQRPRTALPAVTTQIGDDRFTFFATTFSERNFLELLRAGYEDCVINAPALAYTRRHVLAGPVIAQLEAHECKVFADQAAWSARLDRLGISQLEVLRLLDPVEELAYLGTECERLGARWPAPGATRVDSRERREPFRFRAGRRSRRRCGSL
jgi:hypothetical protein